MSSNQEKLTVSLENQIMYVNFEGGNGLTYDNGEWSRTVNMAAADYSRDEIADIIAKLNESADSGVTYTAVQPLSGEYSTIYVGSTTDFDDLGSFAGLAETIDAGNQIATDEAFVNLAYIASTDQLISVIDHEAGHLMGESHDVTTGTIADYAATITTQVKVTSGEHNLGDGDTYTVSTSTFLGSKGGAVYATGGAATGNNLTFASCGFTQAASIGSKSGGAIYVSGNSTDVTLNGTTQFTNNGLNGTTITVSSGGALYVDSGTVNIENATFSGNNAYEGGALCVSDGTVTFGTATFSNNAAYLSTSADRGASAIYNAGDIIFTGEVSFTGNTGAWVIKQSYTEATITFQDDVTFLDNDVTLPSAATAYYVCTVIEVTGGAIDFQGNATISGTTSSSTMAVISGILGSTCTITFHKKLTLGTVNDGIGLSSNAHLNWDITGGSTEGSYAQLVNYQYVNVNSGYSGWSLDITVNASQESGTYTIATGVEDNLADIKSTFTLICGDDTKSISVGETGVSFGDTTYSLAHDTTADTLVLTVGNVSNPPEGTVTTEDKWFKAGETVTVEGEFTADAGIQSITADQGITVEGWEADQTSGNWNFTYTGEDTAGTKVTLTLADNNGDENETEVSYTVRKDTAAPTIATPLTYSADESGHIYTDGEGNVYINSVATNATVTATITDATSGVNTSTVNFGGTAPASTSGDNYTFGLTLASDSGKTIEASDIAGNAATAATVTYTLDSEGPSISNETVSGETGSVYYDEGNEQYWVKQNTSASVTATITDGGSGVKTAAFNEAAATSVEGSAYTWALTTTEEGTIVTSQSITAKDNVGNSSTGTVSFTIDVDGTAPTISYITVDPENWTNGEVSIFGGAADEGSGVANVEYRIQGSGDTWTDAGGPAVWGFSADTESSSSAGTVYELRVTDNVGNVSGTYTATVKIDKTAPEIATPLTYSADDAGHIYTDGEGNVYINANAQNATVTATITDTLSGVDTATVKLGENGYSSVSENAYTFGLTLASDSGKQITASDLAGNAATAATVSYTLDGDAATISNITVSTTDWTKDPVTVSGTASDTGSGVAKVEYRIKDSGAAWTAATGTTSWSFDVSTQSSSSAGTVYELQVTDNVGNVSAAGTYSTGTIKIDTTKPTIGDPTFDVAAYDGKWFQKNAAITVSSEIADTLSGLAEVTLDGTAMTHGSGDTYTAALNTSGADGKHTGTLAASDKADNDDSKTFDYWIDGTAATISGITVSPSGWTNGTVTVSGTASDTGSGVASVQYRVKDSGADWSTATGTDNWTFSVSTESATSAGTVYELQVTDNVGNVSTETYTATVKIDKTLPVIATPLTYSADNADHIYTDGEGNVYINSNAQNAKVTATITDALSGVDTSTVKFDGNDSISTSGNDYTFELKLASDSGKQITASDIAGNAATAVTVSYTLDDAGPVINDLQLTGDNVYDTGSGQYWVKQNTTANVQASFSDAASGFKEATFNGETKTDNPASWTFGTSAEHAAASYTVTAYDHVTNYSEESITIGVDGTGPSITLTPDTTETAASVTLTVEITDSLSGVDEAKTRYKLNDGDWQDFSGSSLNVTQNGTYTFTAKDNVGNDSGEESITITNIGHTITGMTDPEDKGSISFDKTGPVLKDTVVTVTATEVEGYQFTGFTSSPDVTFTKGATDYIYTFTMPDEAITVTANYAAFDYTLSENYSGTYDGADHAVSLTVTVPSSAEISYSIDEKASWVSGNSYSLKDAGNATVYFKIEAPGSKTFITDARTINIAKRAVSLESATATKAYDGTELTDSNVTVTGTFASGEGLDYNVTGTQTAVGNSKNTFTYTAKSGTSLSNYEISKTEGTLTVTKADYSIFLSSSGKAYKNNEGGGEITTGVANMGLSFADGKWTMNNFNFSTDAAIGLCFDADATITVTGTNTITGGDSSSEGTRGLYFTTSTALTINGTGTLTVNAGNSDASDSKGLSVSNITVTESVTLNANAGTSGTGMTSTGLAANSITVSGEATVVANGGSTDNAKAVDVPGEPDAKATVTGTENEAAWDNTSHTYKYNSEVVKNATLKTKLLTIEYTLSDNVDTTYDGAEHGVSITVTAPAAGAAISYSLNGTEWTTGSSYSLTDATGSAVTVYFKVEADGYKTVTTNTSTISIAKKALTVTGTTVAGKTYDGTTDAAFSGSTLAGVVGSDEVTLSVSGAFTDKTAGENKEATANYSLGGAKAGNYTVTASEKVYANIAKKSVNATSTANNKEYDGNANATVTGVSTDDFIDGDNVSFTNISGSFTDKKAGEGKTVNVTAELSGTDAANYQLGTIEAATANITKKELTVDGTTVAVSKVYDGNTNAEVTAGTLAGKVEGDTVSIGTATGTFDNKNVGENKSVAISYTLTGTDADNYTVAGSASTSSITAKELTVVGTEVNGKDYDGNTNAEVGILGTLTGTVGGDTVSIDTATASFADKNAENGKTVNIDYTLSGTDAGNYTVASGATFADISKRAITLTSGSAEKVYDGTALTSDEVTVTAGSYVAGETFTYDVTGSRTDVGSSANTFTYADSTALKSNYEVTKIEGMLTVTAAEIKYTLSENVVTTYDKNAYSVSVSVDDPGAGATVSYSIDGKQTWQTGSSYSLTDAGTATVYFKIEADNYETVETESRTITINQKALTVSGTTVDSKIYNGNTDANVTAGSLAGVLDGDTVTLGATGSFADKNAGTNKDVTVNYSISGAQSGNYTVTESEVIKADISPKALTVDGTKIAGKTYDGTTDADVTAGSLVGVVDGDTVTLGAEATFADKNAGTNKNVMVNYEISGAQSGNYTVTESEVVKSDISKRAITLESSSAEKIYDGTPLTRQEVTVTAGSYVTGETFTYDVTGSQTDVGSSANTFTYADSTALKSNYEVTKVEGTLTVKVAQIEYVLGDDVTVSYDGEAHGISLTVTAPASGTTVSYSLDGGTTWTAGEYTLTDAGTAMVCFKIEAAGYTAVTTESRTITINQKALSVDGTTVADKIYDGTTDAEITAGSLNGVVGSDDVSIDTASGAFADKNVGTGKEISVSYTLTGAKAGNYTVSGGTVSASITPKELTVDGTTVAGKTYDGTTDADVTAGSLVGVVDGDTVTLGAEATFVDKNAGTNKNVMVNYEISGAQSGNYSVTESEVVKADIAQKALAVEGTTVDDKIYDGTTDAAVTAGTLTGIIGEDQVAIDTASGAFADKNAGTDKNVTVSYTLTGADRDNYLLADETAAADIARKEIALKSANASKNYDGEALTDNEVIVTSGEFVSGEGFNYDVTGSQTEIGVSANTFTYTGKEGTSVDNYAVTKEEGTLVVAKPDTKIEEDTSTLYVPETETQEVLTNNVVGVSAVVETDSTKSVSVIEVNAIDGNADVKSTNEGDLTVGTITAGNGTVNLVTTEESTGAVTAGSVSGYDVNIIHHGGNDLTVTKDISADQNVLVLNDKQDADLSVAEITANVLEIRNETNQELSATGKLAVDTIKIFNNDYTSDSKCGVIKITQEIEAAGELEITNANQTETEGKADSGIVSLGTQEHTAAQGMTIINLTENIINGGYNEASEEQAANIHVTNGNVTIRNDGHINANVTAAGQTISITNTSIHTLIGNYTAEDGTIVFEAGAGAVSNSNITAANITINANAAPIVDENTRFTFTDCWTNNGTITVAVSSEAQAERYTIVSGTVADTSDWGNIISADLSYTISSDLNGVYANRVHLTDPVIDGRIVTLSEDAVYNSITIKNGGTLIVEADAISTGSLILEGTGNVISGNTITAGTVSFADGAELGMNKDQYDILMAQTEFTSSGKLNVTYATGNALRPVDVDILMNKANVNDVAFEQDLIDVNKLNVKNTKAATISFRDAYGTKKSDTIRFWQDTNVTFGSLDNEINLNEGNNKIQIDKNASIAIKSDLTNISTVKAAAGSDVKIGDIDFQLGRNASLKAEGTCFHTGSINGTDRNTTLTIGKGTDFNSGNIALREKNDKISVKAESNAGIGTIGYNEAGQVVFNGTNLDFNGGNDTLDAKGAVFATGAVDFGTGNDKLSTGTGTKFLTLENWVGILDEPEAAEFTAANITFGDGNDKLTTGKSSLFGAGNVYGADTISLGAYSTTMLDNVVGTKKLSISNGKEGQTASFEASAVIGTDANDSYSFGNYNNVDLVSVDFGLGNDTLKLGNNASVAIDSLDFGDGAKDKLTIGKGATLSVNTLDVDSLDTLSMSKDSVLYLGTQELVDNAREKFSKYASQIQLA